MIYCYSPDEKLSQGDIIRHVDVIVNIKDTETLQPKYDKNNAIILSGDCEIDKPAKIETGTNSVLIARVIPFRAIDRGLQGDVRKNRVRNAFYLPKQEGIMDEECYIDWRTFQQVDKNMLLLLRDIAGHYRCTVEKEYFKLCLAGLFIFFKPDDN